MPLDDLLDQLNSQQLQAVTAPQMPVLVLAGPGSGKTRVLTYRVRYLIEVADVPATQILAVTFTNKAAREMEGRLRPSLEALAAGGRPTLGTFHALAAGMLRRQADQLQITRDFVIFDSDDQRDLIKRALLDLNLDPKQYRPVRVHNAISNAKNELVTAEDYAADSYFGEIVRRVYPHYQSLLIDNNAVDFDDLLLLAVELLRQPAIRQRYRDRYRHVLVDEFQDTNTAQYTLLRLLSGDEPDLFVVGDADQSIYRWRGADYRNVHRFQQHYPKAQIILLEQNYRSTQNILDVATAVIERLPGRERKRLFTERTGGAPIRVHEGYDDADEAQFVLDTIAELTLRGEAEPGDVAVMYRTNAQSRSLEEAFLRAGLPYRLVGAQRFYGRREVKDLIAYLRLVHNPADTVSLQRIINVPPRGIGSRTLEHLLAAAAAANTSPGGLLLDLAAGADPPAAWDARTTGALVEFGQLLHRWRIRADNSPLEELIERVLADAGYQDYIDDGTDDGADRWENVRELVRVAQEFSQLDLTQFLEQVALVSDQDTLSDNANAPILLTLHAAKGLEFPVVFIVGLDEGLMPHQRSFDEPEAMAEERRLFYVGITRAQDRLLLVRAFRRRLYGSSSVSDPSRFLDDIPADMIEGNWSGSTTPAEAIFQRQTRWESQTPAAAAEARYRAGMRVSHPQFGDGIVMESRLDRDEEEVIVAFEDSGIKHLLASVAPLDVREEANDV